MIYLFIFAENLKTQHMKERPIIFSTPMVQAILQGRKTMTRRVIKSKTGLFQVSKANYEPDAAHFYHDRSVSMLDENERDVGTLFCPYGNPGDRLWVRETWNYGDPNDLVPGEITGDKCGFIGQIDGREVEWVWVYKASCPEVHPIKGELNWKPSIYMPRSASRILLEIINVRVERVQDISEDDAIMEGAEMAMFEAVNPDFSTNSYKNGFMKIWTNINGNESWNANPWVWVIEFKKI